MNARRLTPSILGAALAAILGVFAFAGAAAFAAGPEFTPEEAPSTLQPSVKGGSAALLQGLLNPGKGGEPGTYEFYSYEFLYKKSATGCEGGETTNRGISLGGGGELVSQEVGGLEPHSEYSVCLVAGSGAGRLVGPRVTFITGPAETPIEEHVSEVTSTSAKLTGTLNPENPGEASTYWEFVFAQSASSCQGSTAGAGSGSGKQGEVVEATLTGLQPGATYDFCLHVVQAGEEVLGVPVTFTTPAVAPKVNAETVEGIGPGSATVSAEIDTGGLPTAYHAEFVSDAQFKAHGWSEADRMPPHDADLPAGASFPVREELSGLQPDTLYHYRFVASNDVDGDVAGTQGGEEGATFSTNTSLAATPLTLPDGRAYELVSAAEDTEVYSPPYRQGFGGGEKGGEFVGIEGGYRASASGDAVAYIGEDPASGVTGAGNTGSRNGNQWLATRAASGWQASDLQPAANAEGGLPEFSTFSADLSVFTVNTEFLGATAEPPAPSGCRDVLYSHTTSGYHALGEEGACGNYQGSSPQVSANDLHVLFHYEGVLYDWVDGQRHQVNILPDGEMEPHPQARFGWGVSIPYYGATSAAKGLYEDEVAAEVEGDVSADGSRIFWTDLSNEVTPEDPAGTSRLFVRENDAQPQSPVSGGKCTVATDACTAQIDLAQPGAAGASGGGRFWFASNDGSTVFFTDESRLTSNSTAGPSAPDLYEYKLNGETGRPGTLIDFTALEGGHADVLRVIGVDEPNSYDGAFVYFTASGVLTHGPNAEGKEPVPGQSNLYLSQGGTTTFIATEAAAYSPEPGGDAQASADGHAVAFMSPLPLTGYDSQGIAEMFVYEAGQKRIFCASCSPTDAPPVNPSRRSVDGGDEEWFTEPRNTAPASNVRWINEAGTQVYFMTDQPLVPQDTNGARDVYEWESEGASGCQRAVGCVTPLSSIGTPHPAYYVDASASGDDVFFTQRTSLTPTASDETVKLYDARVGGGFSDVGLACAGTGCQGVPPAPPIFATPSSVTYNGVGNFEASTPPNGVAPKKKKTAAQVRAQRLAKALGTCRRKPKKRRAACERRAKKQYGPATKRGKR